MRGTKSIAVTAIAVATLGLTTSGCSRIKSNQGYIVDEQLVASVQPGIDNKTSVQRTLGRPTFTSQFDQREWYYISRNTTQLAFAAPKATTQSVIRVTFDARGNVAAVDRRGLEQTASISPSATRGSR